MYTYFLYSAGMDIIHLRDSSSIMCNLVVGDIINIQYWVVKKDEGI